MTQNERFDFETHLSRKAEGWACASDLERLTRCFNNRNLAACQGYLDAFDRCTLDAPFPAPMTDASEGEDDDDEVSGGPVAKVAIALAPQVFDGDAPRKKTWLSEALPPALLLPRSKILTLEKLMPAVFKGEDEDKDD